MKRGAFTLVEILVVVVILGIAAAMIVPQIGNRNDLKAAAAARVVMADLIYAQNRAIATQAMIYVNFDVSGNSYGLLSAMSPATYLTNPVSQTTYTMRFGTGGTHGFEDMRIFSADFGSGQGTVAFDELGVPYVYIAGTGTTTPLTASNGVVLKCGTYSLRVNVEADTGEISVQ